MAFYQCSRNKWKIVQNTEKFHTVSNILTHRESFWPSCERIWLPKPCVLAKILPQISQLRSLFPSCAYFTCTFMVSDDENSLPHELHFHELFLNSLAFKDGFPRNLRLPTWSLFSELRPFKVFRFLKILWLVLSSFSTPLVLFLISWVSDSSLKKQIM